MRGNKENKQTGVCPIKVRYRQLKDGRKRIFLDSTVYDLKTGEVNKSEKHTYKFLDKYVLPEETRLDKIANRQTMQFVEELVRQMVDKFSKERLGVVQRRSSKGNFIDYVISLMEKASAAGKPDQAKAWRKLIRQLRLYTSDEIHFADVTTDFMADFIDHLNMVDAGHNYPFARPRKLSCRTVKTFYEYLRLAINHAYRDGLMAFNPTKEFSLREHLTMDEHERAYLEIPELKALMKLETKYDLEKRAFIFACLCGLRSSDIRQLTWDTFVTTPEGTSVDIVMEKTDKPLHLPISKQAMVWLPERGDAKGTDRVFPLFYEGLVNRKLKLMMKAAGINKHITFHCSRHTFATMMLTIGVDLYTVSKLLGHASVNQTMVYARMVDKKKQDAVMLIPSLIHRSDEDKDTPTPKSEAV